MHEETVMHGLKAKGLKKGSVSKSAAVTIGLAATAPAYSLTGALGYGASQSGYQLPIVFILSVIPMFFVALSYKHLTTSAPDSGTVFTWGTKAIGPRFGWFGGWALLLASVLAGVAATQIIVDALAIILNMTETPLWFHFGVAILFILSTTYLTALGAEESSRTTMILTMTQYGGLIALAAVLYMQVLQGNAVHSAEPMSLEWFNPFAISSFHAFLNGFLVALFIFWGFDASLAMSEETNGSAEQAGRSGIIAMIITVITYVVFATAALAYAGIDAHDNSSLTFKDNIDSIITVLATSMIGAKGAFVAALIIAISAFSATMSTIMPAARAALAMATYRAIPRKFSSVNEATQTPKFATWTIGLMTLIIYITLSLISESIVKDSIHSVSIAVCTYYTVAALSCVLYFHRTAFNHWHTTISQVILPSVAAIILIAVGIIQAWNMMDPHYGSSGSIAGVGTVFLIGVVALLFGVPLMVLWNLREPKFFRGETLPLERAHMVPDNGEQNVLNTGAAHIRTTAEK
ncbi:APC family permease [Nitrosomonas oligotropha]|uniref:Amino acid/polyamine/organocation transporter, APC superfamily n=1 Tax=Nitrosomonas oligotropha TaxID=42354 RepID=A0A1H8TRD4_9PROT|nr:APC family permease [Nitrosomonas oligotropha]SDX35369.1 amino acid/polyamine/organocation transporter, APC superfamily [Nitrosomonas oligotropha]SEO93396.1 amino acid/polyamine/organocation transporter, APC superfamily [Nitrosomonas oligotropha]